VIEALDDEEPASTAAIREAVEDAAIPGRSTVSATLEGEDILAEVLVGLLARRYDLDTELPVEHIGFDLV
jgi:hypothetical protein